MACPLESENIRCNLICLVLKQIDGVTSMMPEQMIGPAARLAFEIDILPSEEESLNDEMLQCQLAGHYLVVYPLMRWIKAARVAGHRNDA